MKQSKTRRFIALLLCIMTLLSAFSMTLSAEDTAKKEFVDVKSDAWYYEGVMWAVEHGYFAGVSADRFAPDQPLTRGQLVVVLAALDNTDVSKYKNTTNFTDVEVGKYYTAAVEWARLHGIVSGVGEGKFAPDAKLTREQLCVILNAFVTRYLGYTTEYINDAYKFNDESSISAWAGSAVEWAQRCGLVAGMNGGIFSPKTNSTRAQAALIIKKLFAAIPAPKVVTYCHMSAVSAWDDLKYCDVINLHPATVAFGPSEGSKFINGLPFSIQHSKGMLTSLRKNLASEGNTDAKIVFVIGNASLSTFESWLAPYDNCKRFAEYFVKVVREWGFDGVDIDYEFPQSPALRENFLVFIKYLREGLNELAEITGKDYIISLAVPGGSWAFDLFDMKGLSEYVSWFNIMDYDLYCNENVKNAHHHTPTYDNANGLIASVNSDIALYKENGIPAAQVNPGCGMYGRAWTSVTPGSNLDGLYQYGVSSASIMPTFCEIMNKYYEKDGYKYFWDDDAKAPYLYNDSKMIFISYDDQKSVQYKSELVRKGLVGGMMFFDMCTCSGYGIFEMAHNAFAK